LFFPAAAMRATGAANARHAASHGNRRQSLLVELLLVFLFFFVVVLFEIQVILVVVLIELFEFERIDAHHAHVRAALIAGDRVAFVQLVFLDVDVRLAHRARYHSSLPTTTQLPLYILSGPKERGNSGYLAASRRLVVAGTIPFSLR